MGPPANSLPYDPGNGIILALYRLQTDRKFRVIYEALAKAHPIRGRKVRSYEDCANYASGGSMAPVRIADLKPGGRYLVHEDEKKQSRDVSACASGRTAVHGWRWGTQHVIIYGIYEGCRFPYRILFLPCGSFLPSIFLLPFIIPWILAKTTYTHDMQRADDIFEDAVDKPIIPECVSNSSHPESSSTRESNAALAVLTQLKAR